MQVLTKRALVFGGLATGGAATAYLALRDGGPAHRLVEERESILLAFRNVYRPGALLALNDARMAAHEAEERMFGARGHNDDAPDALRHATGTALGVLHLMRDEGMSRDDATDLVRGFGDAHEHGGNGNQTSLSSRMDFVNNDSGMALVGDGRRGDGSWMSDEDAQAIVVEALRGGRLAMIQSGELVPTRVEG